MTRRGLQLVLCAVLGCNGKDEDESAEGSGGGGGSSGMPEWEDGAPGATCPEEYDPDRVYERDHCLPRSGCVALREGRLTCPAERSVRRRKEVVRRRL